MPSDQQRQQWRDNKRGYYDKLTPESKAARGQSERQRILAKRAVETPEQTEARRAKYRSASASLRARNRASYNESRSRYAKRRCLELRSQIFTALGDKCCRCGFDDWRALQVDHINGGGREHRRRQGGYHYWKTVLDDLSQFQLLCANCRMIKSYREGMASESTA